MKTKTVVRHLLLSWQLLSSRLVPLKGKFIGGKEREGGRRGRGGGEGGGRRGGEMERRTNKRRGRSEVGLGNEAIETTL